MYFQDLTLCLGVDQTVSDGPCAWDLYPYPYLSLSPSLLQCLSRCHASWLHRRWPRPPLQTVVAVMAETWKSFLAETWKSFLILQPPVIWVVLPGMIMAWDEAHISRHIVAAMAPLVVIVVALAWSILTIFCICGRASYRFGRQYCNWCPLRYVSNLY